ncbi:hypothetical protein ACE6H2_008344 [Prunus campanulata]
MQHLLQVLCAQFFHFPCGAHQHNTQFGKRVKSPHFNWEILKTSKPESSCTKSMREQIPHDISQLHLSSHLQPRSYSFAVYCRLWTKS